MKNFSAARTCMVESQIHTAGVNIPEILQAFETVPREVFVPENVKDVAYCDEDLPIGSGRFLMEPMVCAKMIQALKPAPGEVALDIGGATGYTAAILSSLVTTVVAVEENQLYLDHAARVWERLGTCNIVGLLGSHTEGAPHDAPFDLIFINGAVSEVPAALVRQLSPGGRLVVVLKKPGERVGDVVLVQSLGEKGFSSYSLFSAACPYLSGFEPLPAFNF